MPCCGICTWPECPLDLTLGLEPVSLAERLFDTAQWFRPTRCILIFAQENNRSQRWQLELGGEVIAYIDADAYEFPWTYGNLVDSPRFERFRCYFTDEDTWPDNDPAFEALCEEIGAKGRFTLRDTTTDTLYRGVRLNQENGVVWFRHGDPVAA
jgi:hypothetical protein